MQKIRIWCISETLPDCYQKLTDFYMRMMERAKKELDVDGFFTSDDLGTHFWLHSCGNIELFLPEFIEIGLDVIHPIQKYTMEEQKIAEQFGDKICILAGFDVQQTIPFGTPDDVRI